MNQGLSDSYQLVLSKFKEFGGDQILDQLNDQVKLNRLEIYLYGGFIRDVLLGFNPDDIDYKLVVAVREYGGCLKQIEKLFIKCRGFKRVNIFSDTTVFKINGWQKLNLPVDLVVVINQGDFSKALASSFSINSWYVDLKKEKLFFLYNADTDLRDKIIRLTGRDSLEDRPDLLFRAIYLVTKLSGFELDDRLMRQIIQRARTGRESLNQLIKSKDKMMVEYLFRQIFGGLEHNPMKYLYYLNQTGLDSVINFFGEDYCLGDILGEKQINLNRFKDKLFKGK